MLRLAGNECPSVFQMLPVLTLFFLYMVGVVVIKLGFGSCVIISVSPSIQVMTVIDAAVRSLDSLPSLEEYLTGLGRKHRATGVKLESFNVRIPSVVGSLHLVWGPLTMSNYTVTDQTDPRITCQWSSCVGGGEVCYGCYF